MKSISCLRTPWPWLLFGLATVLLCTLVLSLCAQGPASADEESELTAEQIAGQLAQLREWTQSLESGNLEGLWQAIEASGAPSPQIDSPAFAAIRARHQPQLAPLLQARRDFGLACARALDQRGLDMLAPVDSAARFAQAAVLQDLSNWFRGTVGYGNYLLSMRAINLSAVPIGHLVIDLETELEEIRPLLDQIRPFVINENLMMEGAIEDVNYRKAVLVQEAGEDFIGPLMGGYNARSDRLPPAWGRRLHAAREWFKDHNVALDSRSREMLPENLQLYFEDELQQPHTLAHNWEATRFGKIVNSSKEGIIEWVLRAVEFRETVGAWPTEPPSDWREGEGFFGDNPVAAAFDEAWHRYSNRIFPVDTASRIYREVSENRFMDRETQAIWRAQQREAQDGQPAL